MVSNQSVLSCDPGPGPGPGPGRDSAPHIKKYLLYLLYVYISISIRTAREEKKVMMILLTRENDRLFHLPITICPRLSCHTGRGLAGPLPGCQDGIPCGISCDARPRIRIKSRANPEYSTIFNNILDGLVGAKERTPG